MGYLLGMKDEISLVDRELGRASERLVAHAHRRLAEFCGHGAKRIFDV